MANPPFIFLGPSKMRSRLPYADLTTRPWFPMTGVGREKTYRLKTRGYGAVVALVLMLFLLYLLARRRMRKKKRTKKSHTRAVISEPSTDGVGQ